MTDRSDDASDLRALVDAVVRGGIDGWDLRVRLEDALRMIEHRLPDGPEAESAADQALTYLEMDPYYFWSGYARARIARRLAASTLTVEQRLRARDYVLEFVDGTKHCAQPAIGQLARAVVDNPLRASLRSRLQRVDVARARRALRVLTRVRHPGLTREETALARDLVLHDAANTPWLQRNVERLARWLWTPEWEAELRDLTQHHGPERAAAKKLIESMDRRRGRRPGP